MSSNHYEDTELTILLTGRKPTVDIVAVENIGEAPLKSWTYEKAGRKIVWLQDKEFLQQQVPTSARVFSFGYRIQNDSHLVRWQGTSYAKLARLATKARYFLNTSGPTELERSTDRAHWPRLWRNVMHEGIVLAGRPDSLGALRSEGVTHLQCFPRGGFD